MFSFQDSDVLFFSKEFVGYRYEDILIKLMDNKLIIQPHSTTQKVNSFALVSVAHVKDKGKYLRVSGLIDKKKLFVRLDSFKHINKHSVV